MTRNEIEQTLAAVAAGRLDPGEALVRLSSIADGQLDIAELDHQRQLRCGFPEVVFGAGKTPDQISRIIEHFVARNANVLVTRLTPAAADILRTRFPQANLDETARTLMLLLQPVVDRPGTCIVVTAGTSDLPVAGEAVQTLTFFGCQARLITDVGVAGIHRVLQRQGELRSADVIIVVAGMDGALPSVIGGLVHGPVIAVPTSVGYGASFGGVSALLTMLNSCAGGITVTNIDNGFGAACAANRILMRLRADR